MMNAYDEWIRVKAARQESSRRWCKRHGLQEQRLYEITKLRRQFEDLLSSTGLLWLGAAAQRARKARAGRSGGPGSRGGGSKAGGGGTAASKDRLRELKMRREGRKRKVLQVDHGDGAGGDGKAGPGGDGSGDEGGDGGDNAEEAQRDLRRETGGGQADGDGEDADLDLSSLEFYMAQDVGERFFSRILFGQLCEWCAIYPVAEVKPSTRQSQSFLLSWPCRRRSGGGGLFHVVFCWYDTEWIASTIGLQQSIHSCPTGSRATYFSRHTKRTEHWWGLGFRRPAHVQMGELLTPLFCCFPRFIFPPLRRHPLLSRTRQTSSPSRLGGAWLEETWRSSRQSSARASTLSSPWRTPGTRGGRRTSSSTSPAPPAACSCPRPPCWPAKTSATPAAAAAVAEGGGGQRRIATARMVLPAELRRTPGGVTACSATGS